MPSIDCSLSVTPETEDSRSFPKVIVGLILIMVYNAIMMYLRRFRIKFSRFIKGKP
ncbi:hypothetical protein OXIME_001505 [Oxyplasma meridianum]|uniref:Uncharacterized protein n=1 Tax=Oxyplasma meridianum TaxID=3073602 RepID=A0AAX4NJ56_9ARCH